MRILLLILFFYATIKIHKPNYPIRPIVSFIDSPTYHMAKFLSKLLTPTTDKADQKLKNSQDVIQNLTNLIVPDGYSIVSFDVKSLFTSIPQDLAIESVKYALDQDSELKHRTNIDNVNIMEMVKLCIQANVFQKYDKLYKQVKGVPMGSPISVVIAELTMQYIERDILNNQNWNVIIWKRYVDDCLVIIKTSEIQDFHNFINTINSNIQFEIEIEQQNTLPFLDIKKNLMGG